MTSQAPTAEPGEPAGPAAPPGCAPPPRSTAATVTAVDLALVGGMALAFRLPALAATHHLSFDDGVYGASAVAMRDGGRPFQEVFSSQGPLFLPLVRLADLVGGEGLRAPRLAPVFAGVILSAAVYLAGRELTDRQGALLAGALVAVTGSLVAVTGPIHADGPALAGAAAAFWLALRHRRAPSAPGALVLGLAVGIALSVKATALPVAVPVGWVLLAPVFDQRIAREPGGVTRGSDPRPPARRPSPLASIAHLVLAVSAAAAVWSLPTLVFGPAEVWEQSVTYHLEAKGGRDPGANAAKVIATAGDRDLVLVAGGAAALTSYVRRRRLGCGGAPTTGPGNPSAGVLGSPTPVALAWSWLLATLALLLVVHPLWRPHVAGLAAPLALLAGTFRPAGRTLAILVAVLAPLAVWRAAPFLVPGDADAPTLALRTELELLPPTAWVISDEPGLVWMAGRRTPDDLVDTSRLRIEAGHLTPAGVAAAAADPRVCAVVAWSPERFGAWPDLAPALVEEGYVERARFEGDRTLFRRERCTAP